MGFGLSTAPFCGHGKAALCGGKNRTFSSAFHWFLGWTTCGFLDSYPVDGLSVDKNYQKDCMHSDPPNKLLYISMGGKRNGFRGRMFT